MAAAPEMLTALYAVITHDAKGIESRGNAAIRLEHINRIANAAIRRAKK